ncbi:hypothetical protein D3C75_788230 [compost metagenome]
MRVRLHLRTHPGDLHAEEGKQHTAHQSADDAYQPIAGEELQYLLPGGKAAADHHGHVSKRNLDRLFIHYT